MILSVGVKCHVFLGCDLGDLEPRHMRIDVDIDWPRIWILDTIVIPVSGFLRPSTFVDALLARLLGVPSFRDARFAGPQTATPHASQTSRT